MIRTRRALFVVLIAAGSVLPLGTSPASASSPERAAGAAAIVPSGFSDTVAISGLTLPTDVAFAADGRVFVAEKSGLVKVFDSLGDTTPTVFADLRTQVHNFLDRGLLGLTLDPQFPASPYVYVLYTYDAPRPHRAPVGDGRRHQRRLPRSPRRQRGRLRRTGRLSRLAAAGDRMSGPEHVLVSGWCQQFPSHSIGTVRFGPDGALYAAPATVRTTTTSTTARPRTRAAIRRYRQAPASRLPAPRGLVAFAVPAAAVRAAGQPRRHDHPGRPRHRRRPARQPVRLAPRPERGGSSPTGCATRSASTSVRGPTSCGWVTSAGGLGGDQPHTGRQRRRGRELRLALLRGAGRQPGYDGANLNRCESLYPLVARPGLLHLPPQRQGRGQRCVPGRHLLDQRDHLRERVELPGRLRRRCSSPTPPGAASG